MVDSDMTTPFLFLARAGVHPAFLVQT